MPADLLVAAPDHAHWDTSAIEARIINGAGGLVVRGSHD